MTAPTLNSLIDDYANTPNDNNAPLPNLNVGDSITGVIEIAGDNDLFAIQLNAGAHYSFGVKGSDTGSGTLSDPYLTVLDSTGAVITSDDDSGIYNNALLPDFVAPSTGTYYVSASGNNLSTGSYTLTTIDNANAASYNLTGSVFIIGTFSQNQTLYAASNLVDINGFGGNIVYHWWANNQEIGIGSSYVLTELQVGMAISVTASYSSFYSSSSTVINVSSSVSNTTVININDVVVGEVIINGIFNQGQTLTATNSFYDADGLGTVVYSWYANNILIATGSSYTLTENDVSKSITVTASYTDGHGTVESKSSEATANTVVTNVNDAPTGEVIINGNATQGQTLIASNTLVDGDGLGVITYTWQADTITVGTGVSYTLTETDVGKSIQLIASYTDLQGTAETVSSSLTATVANINDAPTGAVSINGTVAQGQILTASNNLSDADGLGAITYTWQANTITLGTGSSYTLTKAEVDKTITVIASYIDGHGTSEHVSSPATAPVTNINEPPTGSVTISGIVKQGQILTANNTLVDKDGLGAITYQWKANNITIATANTYTLTESEVGKIITVTANYTDGHHTQESVSSKATNAVVNVNDAPTGSVTIAGTSTQGQTLTVSNTLADADGLGVISYQWKADAVVIGTGTTYTLTASNVGKKITAVASYTDGHGTLESKTSLATATVQGINHLPTGKVIIAGTATQGQVLTVSNTIGDTDGLGTITYTWLADGAKIAKSVSSYTLTEAQVGKVITVLASYTDGHNIAESVTSNATRAVVNINDNPTGKVTISGTVTQNQVLTASNTLNDADGLGAITYTWKADATKTIGTGNSISLAEAQVGKVITVIASYTDAHGKAESVTSNPSRAVVNVNDDPTGTVTIKGTAAEGKTLTATNNLADADGMGAITYTWKMGATVLGTGNTYVLTNTEVGKKVFVTAQYTDGNGTVEKVNSDPTLAVTNIDPSVKINPLQGLSTCENDGKGTSVTPPKVITFNISLNTQPLHNVTLNFSSSDTTEGVITGVKTMTFTASNWNVAQVLTVTGVNDYLNDGDITYQLKTTISTIDVDYKALIVPPVDLVNKDDGRDVPQDIYGDVGGSKIDKIVALDGNDKIHGLNMADDLSGGLGNDTIWGGYGDDNLFGNDGNDYLWGEQENDYLDGGTGNDTLDGGTGADTMIGGAGNDTYYLGYDATDVITDKGLATDVDTVIMPYQMTSYTLPTGIENGAIGTDGTQDSSLTGNNSDNSLTGNAGNNTLGGGLGRDSLFGGVGNDVLDGGTGNDALTGGAGQDSFVFDTALTTNIDNILDFSVVDDTFKLSKTIFTTLTLGNLAATAFQVGTAAVDVSDRIIYNKATGALYYDDDGTGAHASVQIATIGVNLTLSQADFVVIA